ncbi:MAG: hypothetical protein C0485_04880 [Pirellula sp.]|nr:hypothetical protein [Pirellula sp.]
MVCCTSKLLSSLFVIALLAGCSSKPAGGTVKGTVTLDGQPLATGRILFIAVDQGSPSAEAAITAGQFETLVLPGDKRVEIRSPKVTGKKKMYNTPDSPTIDTVVELLPAKYNVNSELKMTVDGTAQEQKFDLLSK